MDYTVELVPMLAAYGYKFVFDACKILIRSLRQSAMLDRIIPLKHDIEGTFSYLLFFVILTKNDWLGNVELIILHDC